MSDTPILKCYKGHAYIGFGAYSVCPWCELVAERKQLMHESTEAFKANIRAVTLLGLDTLDAQPILSAVQEWTISTGRARELLRAWILGTFDPMHLPPPIDLGIGEEDLAQVLKAAHERAEKAEAELADAKRELEGMKESENAFDRRVAAILQMAEDVGLEVTTLESLREATAQLATELEALGMPWR